MCASKSMLTCDKRNVKDKTLPPNVHKTFLVTKLICEASLKGELQRENKLISYERAFKMLENDMYIAGIGQVVLELLNFKFESRNH